VRSSNFIEGFYNPRRRHSSIGYLSPIDYGRQNQAAAVNPNAHKPAAVLAAVKDKPFGRPREGAVLDRRSARQPHHRTGRDGRMAPPGAEPKNVSKREDNMPSDQIARSQTLSTPRKRGKSRCVGIGGMADGVGYKRSRFLRLSQPSEQITHNLTHNLSIALSHLRIVGGQAGAWLSVTGRRAFLQLVASGADDIAGTRGNTVKQEGSP
jgi:hypothetical protein